MTDDQAMPEPLEPRPGALLVALSALVIGGCLLAVSACLAAVLGPRGVCGTDAAVGLMLLPPLLFLGIQQYRGVFHRRTGAAFVAACALFAVAGLYCFLFGMLFLFVFTQAPPTAGEIDNSLGFAEFGLMGLAAIVLLAARETWRWSDRLWAAGLVRAGRTFTLRELLAGITMVALVAGGARYRLDRPPRIGENVAPSQAPFPLLPAARDVCYRIVNDGSVTIEFTTDEVTFRSWVDQVVVPLTPDRAQRRPLAEVEDAVARGFRGNTPLVSRGLEYSWEGQGEKASAIFDRQSGRVYFFQQLRR